MDIDNLAYALNTFYFLVSAVLVMWMAVGFAMLEAGSIRSKNVGDILLKNIAMYSIASLTFLFVGYELMYGHWSEPEDHSLMSDFFFQVVCVAAAMSIMSGVVAERKKLWPFLVFACFFTAVLFPIQGAWSWGGGWLNEIGFVDVSGAGVVHLAGASAALAGLLLIGARIGKYNEDGSVNCIEQSSSVQMTLGVFILWMGWFGFNGGSQLSIIGSDNAESVSYAFVNTNVAAASGLISAMIFSQFVLGRPALSMALNGALAGLVVITADPVSPSPEYAALFGVIGGLIVSYFSIKIDNWGLDDPVNGLAVHGVGGIVGLMLVPLLNTNATFLSQLIGLAAIVVFIFLSSLIFLYVFGKITPLRVSKSEELEGSDIFSMHTHGSHKNYDNKF